MSRLIVNGQPVQYRMDPRTPLVFALREASNLTGTKMGCGTGHCGACTVHVDGRAVKSCTVAIGDLEGSEVKTIEALSHDRSHPVQQAFLAGHVVQCGFCIPGMIMAAAALVDRGTTSDADLDRGLANICRCGIYPRLREAIRTAAGIRSGAAQSGAAPPAPAPAEGPAAPDGAIGNGANPAPPPPPQDPAEDSE